ncbi:MAG: ISAs1 family transposase [Moorea sp. SIO1G6]|nr:ISAs1 family transposase [Moorena sp. SIO4E2]NET68975.1 ISAs1 family transposase [Moorena sp. SIO1G6]
MEAFFKAAQTTQWEGIEFSYDESTEAGHHPIEHRQVWVVPITQVPDLPHRSKWKGKTCVVMVKRFGQLWNKTTTEVCFYITSDRVDATILARAIRSHWGIEHSRPWVERCHI